MSKEARTASELEAMIMQHARQRPDCDQVTNVAVTPGQAGWRVIAILRDGVVVVSFSAIDEIASELRAKFDLAA